MAWPLLAMVIGSAIAKAAKGKADERANQNEAISRNNQAQVNLHAVNQNAFSQAMDRALNAPRERGRQGFNADMLMNFTPATYQGLPDRISSRMPTITGGPQLSGQGKLLAQLIRDNAITGMQRGGDDRMLASPQLQGYQGPGRMESILSVLGMIGSGAGAIGQQYGMGGTRGTGIYGEDDGG
jgi:hypothetical protein